MLIETMGVILAMLVTASVIAYQLERLVAALETLTSAVRAATDIAAVKAQIRHEVRRSVLSDLEGSIRQATRVIVEKQGARVVEKRG